ncbi:hypothetical protein QYM36_009276 [Artemia franciscana]|uniref:GDP-fucose protein O-fucosyltransferase 2 n=1 Tax=Artemia franciscana TaxID=6661 RepID=A0AA88KZI0_ARTSF|nr:hypothetical protein QYM36_009276 [Artemia franciscana]
MAMFNLMICSIQILFLRVIAAKDYCDARSCEKEQKRYLFIDVLDYEGFQSRINTFLNIVYLVRVLNQTSKRSWKLVLPPWRHIQHWDIEEEEDSYLWSDFFNLSSIGRYTPVEEFYSITNGLSNLKVDKALKVSTTFSLDTGKHNRWEERQCNHKYSDDKFRFIGLEFEAKSTSCIISYGKVSSLAPLLEKLENHVTTLLIIGSTGILHDNPDGSEYWKGRRSLRYTNKLYKISETYRQMYLQSKANEDGTRLPEIWEDEMPKKESPKGGNYICGHVRRGDFKIGRAKTLPSLSEISESLIEAAELQNTTNIYLSTDADDEELKDLREAIPKELKTFRAAESTITKGLNSGEVAIVDIIICSKARYFIGTYMSTFSKRIREEREIFGFHPNSTFNRFYRDNIEQDEFIEINRIKF